MRVLYRIPAQISNLVNRGCSNATGVRRHILYIFTDHIGRCLNTSVQAKSSYAAVWEATLVSYQAENIQRYMHDHLTGGFRSL